jgi:hypothetical protein
VQGPENRDESKGNSIVKLSLQFIPIFGANTKNIEGLPSLSRDRDGIGWHEAFVICSNSNIISILNCTSPYLVSQVSARGIP